MKRYPAYKDSGVVWIDQLPSHWNVSWLKHLFDFEKGKNAQKYTKEYLSDYPGEYPVYSGQTENNCEMGKINHFEYETNPTVFVTTVGAKAMTTRVIQGCYSLSQNCALIRPKSDELSVEYYEFLLQQLFRYERGRISLIMQPSLRFEDLVLYKIPYPPTAEQKQAANYLDHKTRLIDTLIEKKQKQIELLQEQRTAIINHAVTKGLNPNVKMKDTGIEWLGEVPEHWEIKRLKSISKIRYGLGQPPKEQDGGLPLIRATNIKRGRVVENGMVYVNPDDVPYDRDPVLRTDDIVVVRSGAYTADSAIIPEKYDGAIVGYDMVVKIHNAIPKLISYALLSSYVLENQLYLKRLRAAQPHLNAEELGETIILIPPGIEEQREILTFIEMKSYQIDRLISRTEKQIELLKECRTTLISEVVTGKIDVRDEVIP